MSNVGIRAMFGKDATSPFTKLCRSRFRQKENPKRPFLFKRCTSRDAKLTVMNQSSQKQNVEILALTDSWVAVNKPPGMLVHRTKLYHAMPHEKYVVDIVSQLVSARKGSPVTVKPVQRLDRPTSGVMVFALGCADNAARLQATLQSSDTEKLYWALVWGADMPEKWVNEHSLMDLTGKNRKQRSARTEINKLIGMDESDLSIVSAKIRTGRRHQVRRHLSNSRHSILGDTSYGRGTRNRKARENFGVSRCCLHAWCLTFQDPVLQERVRLDVPVPSDLQDVVKSVPDFPWSHDESFWTAR